MWKGSLSLFRVRVLTVAADTSLDPRLRCGIRTPPEGLLSSRHRLLFSSLLEVTMAEGYSPLSLCYKQLHPWP